MSEVRTQTATLIAERPDLAEALEEIIAVDQSTEVWEFDDVAIDPGRFGEIVSRDIVVKAGDGYRLNDPDAVRAVLAGEPTNPDEATLDFALPTDWRPSVDPRTTVALAAVLALLAAMRTLQLPTLYRDEHRLSPANDPYFYRTMVDRLLAQSSDPFSLELVTNMPARAVSRRPFSHAMNWWVAALLGGDQTAATLVALWLPVVASIGLGIVIYFTAKTASGDVRVGIAAVFFLALVPVHAVYTQLGFLEHRLHQYFWLGVTLLAVTWLASDVKRLSHMHKPASAVRQHLRKPRTWIAALAIGPALAFSMHAWGGSIMMMVPLALYAGGRALIDVREGITTTLANLPLLIGTAFGVAIAAFLHFRWEWHDSLLAYWPPLILVGMVLVFVIADLFRRIGVSSLVLGISEVIVGIAGIAIFTTQFPDEWDYLQDRADTLFTRDTATETMSLFTDAWTPITQIGLDFVLALFVLAFVVWMVWRQYEPAWLLLCTYALVWLVFASFQIRFAAQMSIIMAVFGGLGFVYLLGWIGLARRPELFAETKDVPRPDTESDPRISSMQLPSEPAAIGWIALILLLFTGMSLMFIPLLGADTMYDDDQYDSLLAIESHNESVAEYDHEYFVLSNWGDNRMYNYLLHGDGDSYGYASSNYQPFIESDHPDDHYDEIASQVGYVVIDDLETTDLPNNTYTTLHGDINDTTLPDSGHFQALHLGDTASAYATVPGATITVNGTNESITTTTAITLDDTDYTYERTLTESSNTTTATTVAYPGDYDLFDQTVSITQEDVINGSTIELDY